MKKFILCFFKISNFKFIKYSLITDLIIFWPTIVFLIIPIILIFDLNKYKHFNSRLFKIYGFIKIIKSIILGLFFSKLIIFTIYFPLCFIIFLLIINDIIFFKIVIFENKIITEQLELNIELKENEQNNEEIKNNALNKKNINKNI